METDIGITGRDRVYFALDVIKGIPADTKLRNGKKLLKAAVDTLLAELKVKEAVEPEVTA